MPPQQESRCWILALVVGLIAVTGLTAVTLWFALRASDDVNQSQQVGEHDWGSTQEQALVEEVMSTSTAGELHDKVPPEHHQVVEHLEDIFVSPEHREDLSTSTRDSEDANTQQRNKLNETDPNALPSSEHQLDQQKTEPVSPQPLESMFINPERKKDLPASVSDGGNVFVTPEERNKLKKVDKVMIQNGEGVFVQPESPLTIIRNEENAFMHPEEQNKPKKKDPVMVQKSENGFVYSDHLEGSMAMTRDGVNSFVHPEEMHKLKKTNPVMAQKSESVFVHPEHPEGPMPMIRDGVNSFVLPDEIHKLKKTDAIMVKMTDNAFVHPEELGIPQRIIADRNSAFLHPEEGNKLKRMDLEMPPNGESVFMHPEHPSIFQKKEPGLIQGYKNTFIPPPEDDEIFPEGVHEHRNQLEKVESEDEHFFSQYFEYPHDRDHHGQTEDGQIPWETEHEDYLYKGPEQYDGEEPEYSENPIANFLQQKLQDLYNWISSDEDLVQGDSGTGRELLEVVQALNRSLAEGNSSLLVDKLKQIYQSRNGTPNIVQSNSMASFGLLAFDLLLLRNVQQIAWQEDNVTAREMMQDPEVLALSALFMPPEEVRQLQDPGARQKDVEKEDKGIFYDIMEFINGSLRAVLNLGRAYRDGSNVLDCVWTLYCRNLDKSAGLRGPYGFLARINSVGLRLAMGDFPLENTLELLVGETSREAAHMDCDKLFPRCKTQEAAEVVLKSTLG